VAGWSRRRRDHPYRIIGRAVGEYLPSGAGAGPARAAWPTRCSPTAPQRRQATDIWLWGQGGSSFAAALSRRLGVSSAASPPTHQGHQRARQAQAPHVPGATAFLDTDYAAKAAWRSTAGGVDFVYVREAPDEAGPWATSGRRSRPSGGRPRDRQAPRRLAARRRAARPARPPDADTRAHARRRPVPFVLWRAGRARPPSGAGSGSASGGGLRRARGRRDGTSRRAMTGRELMALFLGG
jgi:2,3-bisphosphoglycerate-independent phosphoglycerate mutase